MASSLSIFDELIHEYNLYDDQFYEFKKRVIKKIRDGTLQCIHSEGLYPFALVFLKNNKCYLQVNIGYCDIIIWRKNEPKRELFSDCRTMWGYQLTEILGENE